MNTLYSKLLFLLLFCLTTSCKDHNTKPSNGDIETIVIDREEQELPLVSFVDSNEFEIIPLETNDLSLIKKITKVYLRGDKIIICDDERRAAALIFNRDGSYHAKVHNIGSGPKEYPADAVTDIVVSDNYIGVLAPFINTLKLYNFDGEYVKDVSLQQLHPVNFFTFDEQVFYFISSWQTSPKYGKYNLYKLSESNITGYLPHNIPQNGYKGWGINNHSCLYNGHALVILPTCDTIYSVSPELDIAPRYYVDIRVRKIPDDLKKGDGLTALIKSDENNYIMGVDKLIETERYLFLQFSLSTAVYDKTDKTVKYFAQNFMHPSFKTEFSLFFEYTIQGNKIIDILNARFLEGYKDLFGRSGCENKQFADAYTKMLNSGINEDDNPILLLYTLKE